MTILSNIDTVIHTSLKRFNFFRFDEEKFDTKTIHVNGDVTPSIQPPEDQCVKEVNNHSDLNQFTKDKITRSKSNPPPERKTQNQLNVGNPADFKNSEDLNGSAFEKDKNGIIHNDEKIINGLNEKINGKEIPALPTRGILKRAKLANTKNEDKKGI